MSPCCHYSSLNIIYLECTSRQALTVTRGSQSQRRPSPCCQWPRSLCFKATFYSLLRAFPVCWQILLALPLFRIQIQQLPSFPLLPSILVPGTVGSLIDPNSSPSFHQRPPVVCSQKSCREAPRVKVLLLYVTQSSRPNDCSLTCSDPTPPPACLLLPASLCFGSTDAHTRVLSQGLCTGGSFGTLSLPLSS